MTYNEKKSLYESIMKDVSEIVKRKLNEEFIDKLKDDELHQERDLVLEDIYSSVEHFLDDTYDPDNGDVDLQKITNPVYPATDENFELLIHRSYDYWYSSGDYDDFSLNWIDTSRVTKMDYIFSERDEDAHIIGFTGDVSKWDVSNVVDFTAMFKNCKYFDCDISKWKI